MKNRTTNTLTFKIWKYFVGFAIVIFIILWSMQVIFLQSYYSSMKKIETENLATQIEEIYLSDVEYTVLIDKIAYKNLSNVYIIDFNNNLKYNSYNNDFSSNKMQIPFRSIGIDISEVVQKFTKSNDRIIRYTYKVDRLKTEIYIYAKLMKNNEILILSTSIDPIDATTSVLKNQLIYVTIIALLISAIISIFISKKISQPIKEMKNSAEKLAKGKYDIKFKNAGYSELDELADTLNFTANELSKTDKIRKELIANISHDLKTPLTMIKAYSEMIRDLSGDNKQKREEHLKVIIDESDRLTRLVNDMMDLSKIESGKLELNLEKVNYSKIVEEIVNRIKNMTSVDISIISEISNNILVYVDKIKIEQVLYNLIINAINHSGDEKDIIVKVSIVDKKIKTEVIDHGIGIAKEDIPHIFDRYYKCDKLYKREVNGSGLGLSIVKNILIAHNANYGVFSTPGEGSNFWFELEKVKK